MVYDLSSYRKEYNKYAFDIAQLISKDADPSMIFMEIFHLASKECEANAATLSTYSKDRGISSRILLVKEHDDCNFKFFTNYESRKGKDLDSENRAALLFFYPNLEVQIRFEGVVAKLSDGENDTYFYKRPYRSQLGACISDQSREITSPQDLETKFSIPQGTLSEDNALVETLEYLEGHQFKPIRPRAWGGYLFESHKVEFWIGGEARLHRRYEFSRQGGAWVYRRLNP